MALSDPALASESPLTPADLGEAEALVRDAGWNQTAADWKVFLDLGQVRAVRTSAGRVIATAATLPYRRFAWISMVLVDREFRRQGLASRLLTHCIDDLARAQLVPVLDATPAGRAVYAALGFVDTWGFQRLVSRGPRREVATPAVEGFAIEPVTESVWPALCALDAAVFGADRNALLANLRRRRPEAAFVATRGGSVAGFVLAREGRVATHIGPVIAEADALARALLARALGAIDGPVYLDLADAKPVLRAWLDGNGFVSERPFTRMLYRREAGFDDPSRTYAVIGAEFG